MQKLNVCTIFFQLDNDEAIVNLNKKCLNKIIKYYVINKGSNLIEFRFLYKYFTPTKSAFISQLLDNSTVEYRDEIVVRGKINQEFINNLELIGTLHYSQIYLYSQRNDLVLVNVAFGRELMLMNISADESLDIRNIVNKTLCEISKIKDEAINLIPKDFEVGCLNFNYYMNLTME